MTTPIATFEEILAAMENNPRLQAAMRQHVLDQEFLQLPAIVRELHQAVAQLIQLVHDYITVTDARLGRIETRLDKIEGDIAEIKDQQATMSSQIANLSGSDYESKAIEQSRRLIRRNLAMVKATVIHASRWEAQTFEENMLLPAIAEGRISQQHAEQLEEADSIIRCEDQDGNVVHALAEISITVQDTDRRRASERAEILATVTGTLAVPFVVGKGEEPTEPGTPKVTFLEYAG